MLQLRSGTRDGEGKRGGECNVQDQRCCFKTSVKSLSLSCFFHARDCLLVGRTVSGTIWTGSGNEIINHMINQLFNLRSFSTLNINTAVHKATLYILPSIILAITCEYQTTLLNHWAKSMCVCFTRVCACVCGAVCLCASACV